MAATTATTATSAGGGPSTLDSLLDDRSRIITAGVVATWFCVEGMLLRSESIAQGLSVSMVQVGPVTSMERVA